MKAADAFAPAKINLTLHVTGRRGDGYHLLDSLVAFADVGDRITLRPAPQGASFRVIGPRAQGVPEGPENLVRRAAELAGGAALDITLDKHLPAAAGIGGGSSDAAAFLRAHARLTGRALPPAQALTLGADVPVCLVPRPQRMRGIGEVLEAAALPQLPAVLVNPGVSVPTPQVFGALPRADNPPMPEALPRLEGPVDAAEWLAEMRNDLQPPAEALRPEITQVLEALRARPGCLLARMSGSGATCFALMEDAAAADRAAKALAAASPGWWVRACTIGAVQDGPAATPAAPAAPEAREGAAT